MHLLSRSLLAFDVLQQKLILQLVQPLALVLRIVQLDENLSVLYRHRILASCQGIGEQIADAAFVERSSCDVFGSLLTHSTQADVFNCH